MTFVLLERHDAREKLLVHIDQIVTVCPQITADCLGVWLRTDDPDASLWVLRWPGGFKGFLGSLRQAGLLLEPPLEERRE